MRPGQAQVHRRGGALGPERDRIAARGLVRAGLRAIEENEDEGLPRVGHPPPPPEGIVAVALAEVVVALDARELERRGHDERRRPGRIGVVPRQVVGIDRVHVRWSRRREEPGPPGAARRRALARDLDPGPVLAAGVRVQRSVRAQIRGVAGEPGVQWCGGVDPDAGRHGRLLRLGEAAACGRNESVELPVEEVGVAATLPLRRAVAVRSGLVDEREHQHHPSRRGRRHHG